MDLWLSGVYDQSTFNFLRTNEVETYIFDLRPTSLNFIQEYKLLEILEKEQKSSLQFQLLFENEKDFVIDKILSDAKQKSAGDIFLEFTGNQSREQMEAHRTKFYWHFNTYSPYEEIINSPYLKGIIFHTKDLMELAKHNDFHQFFHQIVTSMESSKKSVHLFADEGCDFFKSIIDFYHFKSLILPITSKFENSYRDINVNLLAEGMAIASKSLEF